MLKDHRISERKHGWISTYNIHFRDAPKAERRPVDEVYVEGISVTLADPHKHLWTYAIGHMVILQKSIAHVLNFLDQILLYLFTTITTVSLVLLEVLTAKICTPKIHYGMEMSVPVEKAAATSPVCCGIIETFLKLTTVK